MKKRQQAVAVFAIIFNHDGQILLSQRFDADKRPHMHLKWQLVGGGVEFGENPIDALHREVKEEIGVKIKVLTDTPFVYSVLLHGGNIHCIFLGYPALFVSGKIDTSDDEETNDARWFEYSKIDFKNLVPETPIFLNKAIKFVNKSEILGKKI